MSFLNTIKNFLPYGSPEPAKTPAKGQGPDLQAQTAWFNRQLVRQRQDVQRLLLAIREAENGFLPKRIELIRTYNDLVMDSHLTALMEQRKSAVLSRKFTLKKGETDLSELIDRFWFFKFLEYAWESDAYGFSLIGLGDIIGGELKEVKLLDRHLVDPVTKQYLFNPYAISGADLTSPEYADWYVLVGEPGNIGWLAKAGFHILSKKFVFTSWDEYAMVFGVPIRVAKIDTQSGSSDKDEVADDLNAMGPAGVLVMDKSEDFELHGGGQTSGHQIFLEHIKARNQELSKLVVGQTMTTENGSSRSQGEVHERVSKNITAQDLRWLKHVVNSELIPRLVKLKILPQGAVFSWEQDELLSLTEQKDVDDMILRNGYSIPEEYFMEKYGVPVIGKMEPPADPPGKPAPLSQATAKVAKNQVANLRIIPRSNSIHNLTSAVATYKAAKSLYSVDHFTCGCPVHSGETNVATVFDDQYLENVLREFFQGQHLRNKLPEDLYQKTAEYLFEGVASGFGGQPIKFDWGTPDRAMIEALKQNVYIFSAAKTYQQRKAFNAMLMTPEGRVRTWNEYQKAAMPLARDYNQNWLYAEYKAATGQATMASRWMDIEHDKQLFPLLKYSTVGDANVREAHRRLNGIVRPVDDKFWDRYLPKNGWGCRCDVDQLEAEAEKPTDMRSFKDLPDDLQPKAFQFNPGKKKMVFDQNHPYFAGIEDRDKEWAKDNFDLPIPDPKPAPAPKSYPFKPDNFDKDLGVEMPAGFWDLLTTKPNLTIKETGGSYAKGNDVVIVTKNRYTTDKLKKKIAAHEFGHIIHNQRRWVSAFASRDPDIEKVFESWETKFGKGQRGQKRQDGHDLVRSIMASADEILKNKKATGTADEYREYSESHLAVMDTIEALTNSQFGYGHGRSYYSRANGYFRYAEFFAHMTENKFIGNPVFESAAPELYKDMIDLMDKLIAKISK